MYVYRKSLPRRKIAVNIRSTRLHTQVIGSGGGRHGGENIKISHLGQVWAAEHWWWCCCSKRYRMKHTSNLGGLLRTLRLCIKTLNVWHIFYVCIYIRVQYYIYSKRYVFERKHIYTKYLRLYTTHTPNLNICSIYLNSHRSKVFPLVVVAFTHKLCV